MTSDNTNHPQTPEDIVGHDTNSPASNSPQAGDDSRVMLLFFGATFVILLSLLTWPWPYELIISLGGPAEREYVGTVQKITYVGGLGPDTQIDTETRTLLLRGAVLIQKGVRLEQRKGAFDSDVCIVSSDQCWHLMGS